MAVKKPLCLYGGIPTDLKPGDNLAAGLCETGTAGESLEQFDVCYLAVDGKYYPASRTGTEIQANALAMVLEPGGIAEDEDGLFAVGEQFITNASWDWSAAKGGDLYVGATPGSLDTDQPDAPYYAVPVARVMDTDRILWSVRTGWQVTDPLITLPLHVHLDNKGNAIVSGNCGRTIIPFSGNIVSWTFLADPDYSGSIELDLFVNTYANYPTITGKSIVASAPPAIVSGIKGQSSTLTGWTTEVNAGDFMWAYVNSCTNIRSADLILAVQVA